MSRQIERALNASLPAQDGFSDELYEWMRRAPWLALSGAAHALVVLILMAIPWEQLRARRDPIVTSEVLAPPEELFKDPPEEPPPEPLETPEVPEPELVDANDPVSDPDPLAQDDTPPEGEPTGTSDAPFDAPWTSGEIGIGGNAGSKYGTRFGTGKGRGPGGGSGTEPALRAGLAWLAAHQAPDGSWDCDGFDGQCGKLGATTCSGTGEAQHDVGVTGLALLAFLGDGHTTREGLHRDTVARGVKWLKEQQDPDTGLFGEALGHAFLYDHAIATLAICEAWYFSRSPLIKRCAQEAVNYLTRARNPYGAWRYSVPPNGDNDTSVTGWCVLALTSARDGGLAVDEQSFVGALQWLDEATDAATGRCGYDSVGSPSSRVARVNEHFPTDKGEAMTAVALLSRFFLGQDPATTPVMERHAELLRQKPPRWDPDGFGIDMYYWYYASYAMYQMGGSRWWEPWNRALKAAVVESQRKDGDEQGSWDPQVDPWGFAGGRVYSTALMTLCLEVYFRYAKVIGGR